MLHETLTERLAPLPDDTLVAPGHYVPGRASGDDDSYTASLGELRDRLAVFPESRRRSSTACSTRWDPAPRTSSASWP